MFTPNDRLMAESMISNSNTKVFVGNMWIKITVSNSYSQLS